MTQRGTPPEMLRGVVEATNERGIKLDGRWLNYSQFRQVTRAETGQEVEVEVVRDRFINALTIVGGTPGAPESLEPSEPLEHSGAICRSTWATVSRWAGTLSRPSRGWPLLRPLRRLPRGGASRLPLRRHTARRDWPRARSTATPRSGAWP